ncbi:MAG TPA: relaxase/mobilization nuclease domain-containing protein [Thermoanaerobaculia bacterium]|nr:relaxase/mobilization nuclease domain-containing protein [Thermoanaerobaculia bacterium]
MPRKTVSFGQLLEYLNQPAERGEAILQNFRANRDALTSLHGEFLENSRLLPARKNGNILYHEILSFSDLDRGVITPAILEDLTRYYLSLRAPYALAYGKAHFNTKCPHVHLIISANDLESSRRRRLSKAEFQGLKRNLEQYQRAHYPFLRNSLLSERPKGGADLRRKRGESERARRLRREGEKKPARKEILRALVLQTLTAASSGPVFLQHLADQGLRLRARGRTVSLEDTATPGGRRYRLSTLGLQETFWKTVQRWDALPERLKLLETIEIEHARQRWAEFAFRQEIDELLQKEPALPESPDRDRLLLLRHVQAATRKTRRQEPMR